MTMMADEELSELRRFVASRATSSSAAIREFVAHLTTGLSSIARRAMLPLDARKYLSDFVEMWPWSASAPLMSSVRSMLAELDQYGVTAEEFGILKTFCLGGAPEALSGLRRAVDAALFSRLFGSRLEKGDRAEIDAFVATECDSVALAAASLLRATTASEQR
jgi:hypothetical protein